MSRAMLRCYQHGLRHVGYNTAHRWWRVTIVYRDSAVLITHYLSTKITFQRTSRRNIQTCLTVKYCTFSRQSRSRSSCHVAVCCVADRIAPKRSTVYTITDTFTQMQTYCGVKCVVQDGSKLIQHSL